MIFGKHINKYYLRYSYMLLLGLAALAAVDYVQLVVPELYRMTVNGINNGVVEYRGENVPFDMTFLLENICKPLMFVIIAMVIGRFLWRICFFGSAIKVETKLRSEMFDHCKDLSQQYYQENKVGNLMSLFTNDLETIQECFGDGVLMFCDALFLGTLSVIKMFRMNPLLTGLSMIPMVILLISGSIIDKYLERKWDERQEAFSKLSDFSQESFAGIAVIKAFVKEGIELTRFKKLNDLNEKVNMEFTKLSVMFRICVTLFVESVICIILGYGGYLVHKGIFNGGQLVEFIGYFNAIVWPIMAVSQLIEMNSRGKASLGRIGELLDQKIDVCDREDVAEPDHLDGNIEFRHLTFRYPSADYDALSDISLSISAGESIGVIGKVGSGKTTLVDLLLRTYNVPDGTVFIDGHDVNSIPIRSVRQNCAYVPQDNFLFSDTIENNIAFATDDIKENGVCDAAELSDVHENIIEFPEQYKTMLGERGVTVSGGQKQRISIARALMKNANILILDDSVSAVDVETERKIIGNLKRIREGKTTILIAHRITTVEKMDRIVFLDEGRIVAVGPHAELYENCEEYRKMVELQRLDDVKNPDGEEASVNE